MIKGFFIFVLKGCLISKLDDFMYIFVILLEYLYALLREHFHKVCIMSHVICNVYYFMCYKLITFSTSVVHYSGHGGNLFVAPMKPLNLILMFAQVVLSEIMYKYNIDHKDILLSLLVLHIIP